MKALIIGLGSVGRRHLRLLKEHNEIKDLVAYRSSALSNLADVQELRDLDAALATDPDIAFITNPTNQHVETAYKCANAKCDLFIEKPLSGSRNGVIELCNIVDSHSLVTMVGCQLRFSPILQRVKEIVVKGEYGDVLSFEAYSGSYLPDWRPEQDYRKSYSASSETGGGALLDLIHELDYSHWMFGPFNGICGRLKSVSSLEIESEDIAVLTLEGEEVVGTVHLDYCRPTPRRTLEVVCENGVVTADLIEKKVTVETPEWRESKSFEYDRDLLFRKQLDHFLESVKTRKLTCNNVHEGKEVLDLALNAKVSHR